ncbi:polysaccharide biosynthesis protein [Chlorobaculum limnaeum]|nr:nucleoside-diphosphate sugar epimerase/dehydratase [Chlorobaculum limnaeum]
MSHNLLSVSLKYCLNSINFKVAVNKIFDYQRLIFVFLGMSRITKQSIVFAIDCFYILFAVWLSFSLKYETVHVPGNDEWYAYAIALLIALPVFVISGLYRSIFRYSGFSALSSVAVACLQYGILYFITIVIFLPTSIPKSIGILQPLLLLLGIGSSRAVARFWFHPGNVKNSKNCNKEKILIYGAGEAGIQIASALQHNARYSVEGFIDDDILLFDKCINGITVYSPDCVKKIVYSKSITNILLALPSVKKARRQEIIHAFEGLDIHIRTLPGIEEMADGKLSISDIREIEIEDLLGRDPVAPNHELFERCIKNKTILVTGAGGSIGSELCRQIISLNPVRLILVEQSEYNLYVLNNELEERIRSHGYDVHLVTLLADVTDREYINKIFDCYQPETVYHAAAYKHVPLVECNPLEGLRNNVFGTLSVAEASKKSGVKNFILISTDKAVRPTNIMGASKRIAELILQAMAEEQNGSETCFSMVRFGNVLGSSGSVVPLFKNQIKNGGPITVTHQDITRYFMTIPEAAQLVIQAGAMAIGGDVFLLDMGEPVKIIDLAKRMVELSGYTIKDNEKPDGDIELIVTGLRPGEKLYEELLIADNPIETNHQRIFKAHENFIKYDQLREYLDSLEIMIADGKVNLDELRVLIKTIVKGYRMNSVASEKENITLVIQR